MENKYNKETEDLLVELQIAKALIFKIKNIITDNGFEKDESLKFKLNFIKDLVKDYQ